MAGPILFTLLLLLALSQQAMAGGPATNLAHKMVVPAHVVSGVVTSAEDGSPLPGVNVHVKGTTVGVTTDLDGKYSLSIPSANDTLVFSYIGTATQEVAVQGRSTINVALVSDMAELDEVVVTALGIERERRSIAYSVAEVKGPEILQGGANNAVSGLYGKVTGVSIQSNVSGALGGLNITMRGAKSITGNNRPLFVVDGIPIRDENSGYLMNDWNSSIRDLGTGVNDVNTSDIETISFLKGATAAALYGSQAANGVVLITTKKGKKGGGLGVEFSTSFLSDRLAAQPDFQNEFGQGIMNYQILNGLSDASGFPVLANGNKRLPFYGGYSFGPKMDGTMVQWWDGEMRAFDPQPDNFKDLFNSGYNATTSIALSNATSSAVYRLGYTRSDYDGIWPEVGEQRNTFSLTGNLDISTKLSTDIALNYYNQQVHNPPTELYVGYNFGRSLKTNVLKEKYKTTEGYQFTQTIYPTLHSSEMTLANDYLWEQYENDWDRRKDRLVASLGAQYKFTDWLNLRVKAGTDLNTQNTEVQKPNTIAADKGASGEYSVTKVQEYINYGEATLSASNLKLTPDIGVDLMVGASSTDNYSSSTFAGTRDGLVVRNWFSVSNSKNTANTSSTRGEDRTDAVFGSASIGYKDFLFLNLTGRNDWTSLLPSDANSYFYPSVGLSFVFSDAVSLPSWIQTGQWKINYAEVGRGAARYQANRLYNYGTIDGVTTVDFDRVVPPLGLKPERQKSFETSLVMDFFKNRVGFDFTFYKERNVDQIINLGVAPSTGAEQLTVNAATMSNTGIEAMVYGTPISTKNFQWQATVNLAKNTNEVEELWGDIQEISLLNWDSNVFKQARPGSAFGDLYGYDFVYAPDGQKVVDGNGYYAKDSELTKVGNTTPDLTGGIINSFTYKNLTLTAVVDFSLGGDIMSVSNYYGNTSGKWKSTLAGRDEAHGGLPYFVNDQGRYEQLPSHTATAPNGSQVFHDGIILEGVKEVVDGNGNVSYVKNDQVMALWDYYLTNYSWSTGIYTQAIYDNTYVKMRELVLSYKVPARFMRHLPLQNLNISLIGRNLFYFYKNVPNIDPESNMNTAELYRGIEYTYYPPTRSFGFRLSTNF